MTTSTTEPTARLRVVLRTGALGVLVLAAATGALLGQASSIEVEDGAPIDVETFPSRTWEAPFGYVLHQSNADGDHVELVAIDEDGTVLGRSPGYSQRLARVSAAGDVLVFDDVHDSSGRTSATALTVTRFEGSVLQEQWSRGFTVDGSEDVVEELDLVAHDQSGRSVVYGCARTAGCLLIGVDARGRELWRRSADGNWAATHADAGRRERPWPVPEELVVIQNPLSGEPEENHPIHAVDVATGAFTELPEAARLAAGDALHATSRVEGGDCEIGVLRARRVAWRRNAPCSHNGGPPHLEVFGETATYVSDQDELVVVDLLRAKVGRLPGTAAPRAISGTATTAERSHDGTVELRRTTDDEALFEAEKSWRVGDVGVDTVVLHRERTSLNPFAPDRWTEVLVVDSRTGSLCASTTLSGRYGSNRALASCRALVEVDGQTHFVGP